MKEKNSKFAEHYCNAVKMNEFCWKLKKCEQHFAIRVLFERRNRSIKIVFEILLRTREYALEVPNRTQLYFISNWLGLSLTTIGSFHSEFVTAEHSYFSSNSLVLPVAIHYNLLLVNPSSLWNSIYYTCYVHFSLSLALSLSLSFSLFLSIFTSLSNQTK